MLEVLCFAINDLAYRTTFPMQDLLAEPQPQYAQKQFFTASEILTNNAVTPLDYRKLLIDVEGVQNAWLFKAGEQCANLYRQYYLKYSKEEIQGILDYVKKIPDPLPVAKSCCDFLKILDRNNIQYGKHGQLLCDLLTKELASPAKNSFQIRNAPKVIKENLAKFIKLIPANKEEKIQFFHPARTLAEIKKDIYSKIPRINPILENNIEIFIKIYTCCFDASKKNYKIGANLTAIFTSLEALYKAPIEGKKLYDIIKTNESENYIEEILNLLDCIPLPRA